jgi:hypothetical protein
MLFPDWGGESERCIGRSFMPGVMASQGKVWIDMVVQLQRVQGKTLFTAYHEAAGIDMLLLLRFLLSFFLGKKK